MRGTRFPGGMFVDEIFVSYGESGGSVHQSAPRKSAPIENKLHCSLEELYKGASKRMKISRETFDASGLKKGAEITFPEKENEQKHVIPADLVFVIDQISHGTLRSMSECDAPTLRSLVIYGVSF
ncbi:hypothetical protein NC652_027360 [Populus alba x Populus x berolinensis]|nr:hypothetical protein NC652_027360 [Populus alba x Populus x berolinensis]